MLPTTQFWPLLAPQEESAPSGGAKKKKNKKKPKTAATAALATSSLDASESAASTDPEPESRDDSETRDNVSDACMTDGLGVLTAKDAPAKDKDTAPTTPTTPTGTAPDTDATKTTTEPTNGHSIPIRDNDTDRDADAGADRHSLSNGVGAAPTAPADQPSRDTSTYTTGTDATGTPETRGMAHDGDAALRAEVERLRAQVEALTQASAEKHEEAEQLRTELEESEAGREQAETQYQDLLERVEKIKATLGDRLKRDRQELEEAKDRVDELEAQNEALRSGAAAAEAQVKRLQQELDATEADHERDAGAMRSRTQLAQQNWQREKEDLERALQAVRKELEEANAIMGEWEVIALEERSVRGTLAERVADLEEQLAQAAKNEETLAAERQTHTDAIEGLQRALEALQETRKRELREMVSDADARLAAAESRAAAAESRAADAAARAESSEAEVARTAPFEREVREKNALIGKLRHEAIALNEHLTKALRYIKKNRPEDSVDKQVVTNLLLQFLALDRSDPKKFQVLQVVAGMLQWTDEQKEKAGLARPGTSLGGLGLRLPSSPFARTPSTPALSSEFFADVSGTSTRESLGELWTSFLERSVDEAASESGSSRPSVPSVPSVPPAPESASAVPSVPASTPSPRTVPEAAPAPAPAPAPAETAPAVPDKP